MRDDPRLTEYTQLRLLKAQVLMLKGTGPGIEGARRILREMTNSQPKLAEAWQWLAQLELSQEDPRKALDVALRGLAYNHDNGPLLLLKARAEKVRSPAMAGSDAQGAAGSESQERGGPGRAGRCVRPGGSNPAGGRLAASEAPGI